VSDYAGQRGGDILQVVSNDPSEITKMNLTRKDNQHKKQRETKVSNQI
jgi:hypothetical protein